MELMEISRPVTLVLTGDFKFPEVNWVCHTADTEKSRKLLKQIKENTLVQVLKEWTGRSDLFSLMSGDRTQGNGKGNIINIWGR